MTDVPHRLRLHWSHRVLSLVIGLTLAVGAVALWVFRGGGGPRSLGPAADSIGAALRLGSPAPGEVADFEADVSRRLPAGGAPLHPIRAGIGVRAMDVHWTDREGRPFLLASRATGTLNARAIGHGRFELSDVVVSDASVLLIKPSVDAEWNYVPVLGFDRPPSPSKPVRNPQEGIYLLSLRVLDGRVEVRMPDATYVTERVEAEVPMVAIPSGDRAATVDIARLVSRFLPPDSAAPLPLQVTGAHLTLPGGEVGFEVVRAELGETVVTGMHGTWDPDLPGYGFRATGRAERVRLADIRFINPKLPDDGVASFAWQVEPRDGGTHVWLQNLDVTSGESHVQGNLAATFGDGATPTLESVELRLEPVEVALLNPFLSRPLPYSGTLRGRIEGHGGPVSFDVAATLTPTGEQREFTTQLTGEATVASSGVRLGRFEAQLNQVPLASLREYIPRLPLAGSITGKIELVGPPGGGPLRMNVRFDAAGGVVVLNGTVDPTAPEIAYDVQGQVIDVALAQLLEPAFPPIRLTAQFTARGHGTDPRTLDAAVALQGRFAGWYASGDDRIALDASARDGLLHITNLDATLGPVGVGARGEWALEPERTASGVEYRLAVSSLAPLAPYIPLIEHATAGGSVELSGTATGSLQRPAVEGQLRLRNARYGDWGVGAADGSYAIAAGDSLPTVRLQLGARAIQTATAGAFEAVSLNASLTPPAFAVEANADRMGGGIIQLAADGSLLPDGVRSATLRRFVADLGPQRWTLQGPAEVQWGGAPGVVVRQLAVASGNGSGTMSLDGTVYPLSIADFQYDVQALPISDLQELLGQQPIVSGEVWAKGRLVGGATPQLGTSFRIADGEVRGVRFSQIQGSLSFADRLADATITADFLPAGQVRLTAKLPLDVDVSDKPAARWVDDASISGTLATNGLPIAALGPLMPQMEDVQGTASADIRLAGTPGKPQFEGSASLADGAATIAALGRRFTAIEGRFSLANEAVRIEELRAQSDGSAIASGTITFEDLSHPVADIGVELNQFRPVAVKNLQPAAAWGTLTVRGPIPSVTLGGRIRLDDGNILVPEFAADPFQVQVQQFLATGNQIAIAGLPGAQPQGLFQDLSVSGLTVEGGEALWFVTPDARAQLGGEMTVFKEGEDIKIFGTLEGEHGTFTMQAGPLIRRFEIRSAQIRFLGAPTPNPALDITAARVVYPSGGQQIEVLAHVTGTLRNPTLSLSSGGTDIPESELLSFLLFGQPSFALQSAFAGPTSNSLIGSTLVGGFADLLSMTLEQKLVEQSGLGLDYFQVRFGEPSATGSTLGVFGQPTVVVGKEIGNDVFLTVNAGISTLFGDNTTPADAVGVSLEWRLSPQWTLEGGLEPLIAERFSRLGLVIVSPLTTNRQVTVDLRRRWTY